MQNLTLPDVSENSSNQSEVNAKEASSKDDDEEAISEKYKLFSDPEICEIEEN